MSKSQNRPSRWRSLTAALLCPISVLLSVGSLTESWRAVPGSRASYAKSHDTRLLIASQCFVFVLDLVAATTLVVRFLAADARVSTLVTVLSLFASLVLSIVSSVTYGLSGSQHELSTTFWVAVAGGGVTLGTVTLLLWEVARTRRYAIPLTRIAVKQRSLVITFYVFVMYLTLGAVMFKFASSFIYLDSVFFVVQSVLTCGFGDITPPNLGSRIAAMLYYPIGIIFVGVLISEIRETVLAHGKHKFVRMVAEVASDMGPEATHKAERSGLIPRQRTEVDQVLAEGASYEASLRDAIRVLQKDNRRDYTHELVFAFLLFFMFWLIGALGFSRLEGFNYFMSLYFTFIAFSSIGYGELSPETSGGRAFYIGWGILGILCLTLLFSVIADAWLSGIRGGMRRFLSHRLQKFKRAKAQPDSAAQKQEKKRKKDAEPVADIVRDLRAHMNAMLQQDHTDMRARLQQLFAEQDKAGVAGDEEEREEAVELNDAMLDDDDQTIMLLLLKHCDYQLQKLVKHVDIDEGDDDGHRSPTPRSSQHSVT